MSKELTQFKPGESGNPNGRPPNSKKAKRFEVAEIMEMKNCNPFEILADIAMFCDNEGIRCKAAAELASYLAPKLRNIEHKADADSPFTITLNLGAPVRLEAREIK